MPNHTNCRHCGVDIDDTTRASGHPHLCKPCSSEYVKKSQNKARRENPFLFVHRKKASTCNRSGIAYTLDETYLKDLWDEQGGKCAALGIPLEFGGSRRDNTASIDRIVPQLGYTQGNVRWLSWLANRIKNNCTDPEVFRSIADYVEQTELEKEPQFDFSFPS